MARIDWDAIAAHARTAHPATIKPEPAPDGTRAVDLTRVRAFRARASHLDRRLPAGSLVKAARGGLQDSAPRDALVSLHARVDGIEPGSWEDPSLQQIWFRGADYVVPAEDFGVFTLGALPREPRAARALIALGEAVAARAPGSATQVAPPGIPNPFYVRAANVSGCFRIRWDARTVTVHGVEAPTLEPEEARLELARRFLRWLGPASARRFARWAGIPAADAATTWDALRAELAPVSVQGELRYVLAEDGDALARARPVKGVRFLPLGDPYRQPDPLTSAAEPTLDFPGEDRRLINSLTMGRVLSGGEIVASWGRRQERLTIAPWSSPSKAATASIEREGARLAGPIGRPMKIRWLGRPFLLA